MKQRTAKVEAFSGDTITDNNGDMWVFLSDTRMLHVKFDLEAVKRIVNPDYDTPAAHDDDDDDYPHCGCDCV